MTPEPAPTVSVPKELAEQILQAGVNGIFALDEDARVTLWNRRMEQLCGKSGAEILGKRLFDVFPYMEATEGELLRSTLRGDPRPAPSACPSCTPLQSHQPPAPTLAANEAI